MSCNFYIKQNLYCLRRNIANSASEMIFRFSRSFLLLTTCSPKFEVSFIQDTSSALANFNVTCRVAQLNMFFHENVARSASEMHKVYLISLQVKVSFIQDKLCTCRFRCDLHHQIVTVELAIDQKILQVLCQKYSLLQCISGCLFMTRHFNSLEKRTL